ncbi:MAG: S-adenosylmethionine:tRNA ribosyltransferase-isomerase [Bacteroidales bacterium]|nr:S-adenosylmethionine:tRNA ribosyltransferase-isomerase [Bacteroidales bacterium]
MLKEQNIHIDDYDYPLPEERIAFYPAEVRDHSKLLVWRNHEIEDSRFDHLPDFLTSKDLLIFNDSKVIHARLLAHNTTGAAIEIFCLEPLAPSTDPATAFAQSGEVTWRCMVGNARKWKRPLQIVVPIEGRELTVTAERGENENGTFAVTFRWDDTSVSFAEWIEHYGKIPLPPYIKREAEATDEKRYQTVYARYDGSVAAPTAGLHFTPAVFEALKAKGIATEYVTLHVGAGTFKPVSSETIGGHFMHEEKIVLSAQRIKSLLSQLSRRRIAVGTTVTRTLESLFIIGAKLTLGRPDPLHVQQWEMYEDLALRDVSLEESLKRILRHLAENQTDWLHASTRLIILPGYPIKVVQGLVTNFHQPKSTLLLLISAFLGDEWKTIYRHALDNGYRFLSYGDSNLFLP